MSIRAPFSGEAYQGLDLEDHCVQEVLSDPVPRSTRTAYLVENKGIIYLIASRIPPGLGSEVLRLGLEAPGLKARGCRLVLQEGDDVLEEGDDF